MLLYGDLDEEDEDEEVRWRWRSKHFEKFFSDTNVNL